MKLHICGITRCIAYAPPAAPGIATTNLEADTCVIIPPPGGRSSLRVLSDGSAKAFRPQKFRVTEKPGHTHCAKMPGIFLD